MLADDHHAIDGQPTGPQRQRFGDARKDRNAMTGCRPAGQILFRELVDVQRHQIHLRFPPASLPDIAQEKPIYEMLGMGVQAHLRRNQGDLLTGRSRTLRCPDRGCQDGRSGGGADGGEKLSAGDGSVHGRVRVLSRWRYQSGGRARMGRSPAATRPGSIVPRRSAEIPKSIWAWAGRIQAATPAAPVILP